MGVTASGVNACLRGQSSHAIMTKQEMGVTASHLLDRITPQCQSDRDGNRQRGREGGREGGGWDRRDGLFIDLDDEAVGELEVAKHVAQRVVDVPIRDEMRAVKEVRDEMRGER